MKTLNIETLLAGLEKTAGIEKAAEETTAKPNVSAELAGILEKKSEEDVTASALAAGEALAKELLTKLASELTEDPMAKTTGDKKENEIQKGVEEIVAFDNSKVLPNNQAGTIDAPLETTVENGIARGAKSDNIVDEIEDKKQTKEAQIKSENEQMAKSIMEKIAQVVGEATTTPAAAVNTAGATAPNLIQASNAVMTAQDDAKVQPLPGAEGTLNSILEAVVARAKDQGAVSEDLVNGDAPASGAEVADGDSSASVAQEADEVEKAAAVSALVDAGCDFASAVELVKQAEEALAVEADQQEKVAAVNALVEAGYDFDDAVTMVKKAEADLKGTNREQEKQAALEALIESGVDFDQAISMVKQAEIDVYGESK